MDENKEVEQMRSADLSEATIARESAPKLTWFFERIGDGKIFACEEREAWDILNNKSTWKRRDFRMLGTSDGTTYQRVIRESRAKVVSLEPEIERIKVEISRYTKAEENLIMSEAVDMEGDPSDTVNEENKKKVLRIRGILDRLNDQLDAKEEEYRKLVADAVKTATEAELEVAKKNGPMRPGKMNIYTPDASGEDRKEILDMLGKRRS